MFDRQRGGLGAVGSLQFLDAGADMMPGSSRADDQPCGDLFVAHSLNDERQYLAFAVGQIMARLQRTGFDIDQPFRRFWSQGQLPGIG